MAIHFKFSLRNHSNNTAAIFLFPRRHSGAGRNPGKALPGCLDAPGFARFVPPQALCCHTAIRPNRQAGSLAL